jgi:MFS transporter, CP family, cyanate transporter
MASGKTAIGQAARAGGALVAFALVLVVGVNLRATLLSVPPLLSLIQHDLSLNYTETGVLSALPTLVMGLGAWPAGRIGTRIGGRAAVGWGMALVAAATLARSFFPGAITFLIFTGAMSAGVALGQTSIPMLARQWFPERIGFVSALFTDGLTLGETIAAAATYPLMRAWFGPDAWPAALAVWAVPAALIMVLWLWLAPPDPTKRRAGDGAANVDATLGAAASHAERHSVSPWLIGGVMGAGSLIYFGMNNWIAPYNTAVYGAQAAALTPLALFAINVAQLPVTIGLTPIMGRLVGRRWPLMLAGVVCLIAVAGWLWTPGDFQPLWGALMGASSAGVFTFSIAMPALYGHDGAVAKLTGASLMVSYTTAFVGPFIGGALWDTFHLPALALLPVGVAALSLLVLPPLLPRWRDGKAAPRVAPAG